MKLRETRSEFLKSLGWIIVGAIIGVLISVPLVPWVARKLSHEPVVNVTLNYSHHFSGDCTVYTIVVGGKEMNDIKTFEAELKFNGPITSSTVFSGESEDKDGAIVQTGSVTFSPPCNVSNPANEKLPDNMQFSVLGADSNELMLMGHDLTTHSMSTVVVSIYPDKTPPDRVWFQFDGRATYMAYGLELPTTINRLNKKK